MTSSYILYLNCFTTRYGEYVPCPHFKSKELSGKLEIKYLNNPVFTGQLEHKQITGLEAK